jgi:N-acetylglucosaminyl-diphospho-decaprenol L-rhamnosyltransferase
LVISASICIVNYKTPYLVIDCIASFLPHLASSVSVVIVDSNSNDDSLATIREWLRTNDGAGRCRLVELQANGGFSAGYNAAMKAIPANCYLLLNSDTIVRPGAIALLIETMVNYPEAGLFGPQLEWPNGVAQVSCFRDHSPLSELVAAARTRQVTSLLKLFEVPISTVTSNFRPPWMSFAAVLIRSEVLESAGMLDENFFLYFEDCEYCYRARKAGWDIFYVPDARIVHLHGKSSQVVENISQAKRLPKYYYASRTRYFRLRYGIVGPTLANLAWCCGRVISKTRETLGKKERHLPENAWRDIWTNWSDPLGNDKHNA